MNLFVSIAAPTASKKLCCSPASNSEIVPLANAKKNGDVRKKRVDKCPKCFSSTCLGGNSMRRGICG